MRAFTRSAHSQVSFKQDLQPVMARGRHRAVVESDNTECDSVVVQQEDPLRRDGRRSKLTVFWTESEALS
jgi:hypothetical protein